MFHLGGTPERENPKPLMSCKRTQVEEDFSIKLTRSNHERNSKTISFWISAKIVINSHHKRKRILKGL